MARAHGGPSGCRSPASGAERQASQQRRRVSGGEAVEEAAAEEASERGQFGSLESFVLSALRAMAPKKAGEGKEHRVAALAAKDAVDRLAPHERLANSFDPASTP